ncbi:ATP-binding protein [Candidatus Woesearchaeota archaeon]|nr:ATP-binding protein [Candidatus Woesearchaeota archaeon]
MKGQVVSGEFGKIVARQKSGADIELGELLTANMGNRKIILQVYDLIFGSQISQQNRELISGLKLEEENDLEFFDADLRNYVLALLKPMVVTDVSGTRLCKMLPGFFSEVHEVTGEDLKFLTKPRNSLLLGKLRSGSKQLDVDINLDGEKVFSHHVLIPGTTGRGKSVLMSNILWNCTNRDYCGILVLDPHDEYYGRNKLGLKDHKYKEQVMYYTARDAPAGCKTLKINLKLVKPRHFNGVVDFSDAQRQAINMYYKMYGNEWIESAIIEKPMQDAKGNALFKGDTLAVVKRRLLYLLDLEFNTQQLFCNGIFDIQAGESTISDICNELEHSKTIIIDTSNFSGAVELLIGSLIASEVLNRYKRYKMKGMLKEKPVVSIVLEEAPRVLGKEVLEKGQNIFSTIAREGRKFKVGLVAITQLPSLIPREILANMNTKIILGIEMKPERNAIIESSAQDLSTDERNIASLDRGEAIITSNFAKFAIPVKIPFFDDIVMKEKEEFKRDYGGII